MDTKFKNDDLRCLSAAYWMLSNSLHYYNDGLMTDELFTEISRSTLKLVNYILEGICPNDNVAVMIPEDLVNRARDLTAGVKFNFDDIFPPT